MSVVHTTNSPSPDTKDVRVNNPLYKCKYLEPYDGFEARGYGLGTWILLFMTKDEIFDTAPAMKTLATDDSQNLLKFTQYLNPTYISFRAEHLLKSIDNGFDLKIPETRNVESMIREWNNAHGRGQKENITRAFAAVACFKLFNAFRKAVTISQGLKNPQDIETYFENSFYAMLAEFDRGSPHPNTSAIEKWSKVKNLGASLYALAKNFGGDGFFMIFPLSELESVLGRQFIHIDPDSAVWTALQSLLSSTELGCLFKIMAIDIGTPLIQICHGPNLVRITLLRRLEDIHKQFSLPQAAEFTPRLPASMLEEQPRKSPFGYCGSLAFKHIAPNLSMSPLCLLQLVGAHIEEEIIEYMIRQYVPGKWEVIGKEALAYPASKDLIYRHRGVFIPLYIDGAYTLFCYNNPVHADRKDIITFVNPTKSWRRQYVALELLSDWIPKNAPWIPKGLKPELVRMVDSQDTSEKNSGIHIILDAISMAKTGRPELRPLNEKIYTGLRIKYFVHLLNKLQEAANKEALKDTKSPRPGYTDIENFARAIAD